MEKKNDILLGFSQRTVLTQSLRFSLKVLEMNNTELQEFIDDSFNENPFLKENEWTNLSENSGGNRLPIDAVANVAAPVHSRDELFKQIAFFKFDERQRNITSLLYDHILEHRYISGELLKKLSNEWNISYSDLLHIIKKLQTVSPRGMFSFNLQDKIKNILESNGKYGAQHKIFVQHLHTLIDEGLRAFKKRVHLDNDTLHKIISDIKNLDLFCGFDDSTECLYKPTDATIEKRNSDYNVEVGAIRIPVVDGKLYRDCLQKVKSTNDKKYIKEKMADAELLVKSINYRNSALLRIIQEIAHRQNDFFMGNVSFLVPIDAQSIANSIMCHQSTVHRAISNKTVATPCGIFDVKSLMPKGIKTKTDSNVVTDHSVKRYIQTLISNEPKNSPYSDSDIVYFLEGRGINISRRTVAKYRNDLDIANSNDRLRKYSLIDI